MTLLRELPEATRDKFVDLSLKNQDTVRTIFRDIGTRAQGFLTVILVLGVILVSVQIQITKAAPRALGIALACFLAGLVFLGLLHALNFETSRVVLLRATRRLQQIFRNEVPIEAGDTPPIDFRWMYATSVLAYLAFLFWIVGTVEAFGAVTSNTLQAAMNLRSVVLEQRASQVEEPQRPFQSPTVQQADQPNNSKWSVSDTVALTSGIVAFLQFLALIATYAVMRNTARRQLRAYTSPYSVSLWEGSTLTPPVPTRLNAPGVVLEIRNFGQTPAYRMVSWGTIAVIEPINEDKLVVPPLAPISAQTLPPNGSSTKNLWFDRPLTATEIADVQQGIRKIYYHGRIEYQDVYKKRRYTNFRVAYSGVFPPVGNPVMTFCNSGNESD